MGLILKLIRSNGLGQSIELFIDLRKHFNLFLVSIFCNVGILKNLSTTVYPNGEFFECYGIGKRKRRK